MISHETHFIFHTFDNAINEVTIFEDTITVGSWLWWVKVALEEYDFKQVKQMNLHSMVLIINHLSKSSE